jgi:hypothetical protein
MFFILGRLLPFFLSFVNIDLQDYLKHRSSIQIKLFIKNSFNYFLNDFLQSICGKTLLQPQQFCLIAGILPHLLNFVGQKQDLE